MSCICPNRTARSRAKALHLAVGQCGAKVGDNVLFTHMSGEKPFSNDPIHSCTTLSNSVNDFVD
eukprot:6741470-Pyramimonas_sp.AAC.1